MKNLYKVYAHCDLHVKSFPYIFKFNNKVIDYDTYHYHYYFVLAENEEEAINIIKMKYNNKFPIYSFVFNDSLLPKKWVGKYTDKSEVKCEKVNIEKVNISNCFNYMSNDDIAELIEIINKTRTNNGGKK